MSTHMKRSLPFLQVLEKGKPEVQKAIIKHSSPDLILALSEIVLNVLKGVIHLSAPQKRRLSRYKNQLRMLAKKNVSIKKKRKFLVQKGGGIFSTLLPIVATVIGEVAKVVI